MLGCSWLIIGSLLFWVCLDCPVDVCLAFPVFLWECIGFCFQCVRVVAASDFAEGLIFLRLPQGFGFSYVLLFLTSLESLVVPVSSIWPC